MDPDTSKQMKYEFLGNSGLKVSNICLGGMTFGSSDGMFGFYRNARQADEKLSHQILDRFEALGGNFIDTANLYAYGKSEEIIGNWLQKKDRNRFVIATKCFHVMDESNPNSGGLSRRNILDSIEGSLARLKTNYIDLYQTHITDPAVPIEETLRTLDDLVKCGKVRYIGCSNVAGWQLQKIMTTSKYCGLTPMISLQQQYNLLTRHSELEEFVVCRNEGIGVIPWGPLKSGMLTGKYKRGDKPKAKDTRVGFLREATEAYPPPMFELLKEHSPWNKEGQDDRYWKLIDQMKTVADNHGKTIPQVAIRWLLQKDVVTSVIIGATSVNQLEENMGASTGWEITSEQMSKLDEASATEIPYPYTFVNGIFNANRSNRYLKH